MGPAHCRQYPALQWLPFTSNLFAHLESPSSHNNLRVPPAEVVGCGVLRNLALGDVAAVQARGNFEICLVPP